MTEASSPGGAGWWLPNSGRLFEPPLQRLTVHTFLPGAESSLQPDSSLPSLPPLLALPRRARASILASDPVPRTHPASLLQVAGSSDLGLVTADLGLGEFLHRPCSWTCSASVFEAQTTMGYRSVSSSSK